MVEPVSAQKSHKTKTETKEKSLSQLPCESVTHIDKVFWWGICLKGLKWNVAEQREKKRVCEFMSLRGQLGLDRRGEKIRSFDLRPFDKNDIAKTYIY